MLRPNVAFLSASLVGALFLSSSALAQRPPRRADASTLTVTPGAPEATAGKPRRELRRYSFYAGAQAAAHSYMVASTNYPVQQVGVYPVYVFVGYHLRPNVAVQVGFLQHNPPERGESIAGMDYLGRPFTSSDYRDEYNAALPVSVRYCFTGPRRFYLEAQLGVTTEFNRYWRQYLNVVDGQITDEERVSVRATNTYLAGGLAMGYRASSRLNLLLDASALRNLTTRPGGSWDPAKKITPALGVGARYNFDWRRPKA
ncbi:hypothetical protein ACW9KT_21850 [Hymenobacter sp. HD11105]